MPLPRAVNKQFMFSLWLLLPFFTSTAQPYIDIGKLSYYYTPAQDKASAINSQVFAINVTLPVELKKGGDAIILNPFFDQNRAETDGRNIRVSSTGVMAGFLKKDIVNKWDLMTGVIVRKNKENKYDLEKTWQTGGLFVATLKERETRSFKFGLYYNREFFGNFFMPLAGIDWKINAATRLFGVLPGNMILERKVNGIFYAGPVFRALTNSYRLRTADRCYGGDCSAENYLRINHNQLGVFGDLYFLKRIVLSAEAGHTIMRKYRYGYKSVQRHTYTDFDNDNWYIKGSLAYRIRFRSG